MDIKSFENSPSGRLIRTPQGYLAFVPNPLPPALEYTPNLTAALSDADRNIGELAGIGRLLPNPNLLVTPYVRREAVLSSRIEGTLTSVSDLFIFEAALGKEPQQPDVREVYNYVRAVDTGLRRLKQLPLSLRFMRELHAVLMRGVRGEHKTPGEFRTRQNWIGPAECSLNDATYVPPPVQEMNQALDQWEKFVQVREEWLPPLVQCGLIHYQFEAIHPFVDGNGRIGRLLIILFLCERGLLPQPLLYLSAFFERNRDEYYDRLQKVSERGDWEGWLLFFLRGIAVQARDAVVTSEKVLSLHKQYREELHRRRVTAPTLALLDRIFINPYTTVPFVRDTLRISYPTAQAAIDRLVNAGILREVTARYRNRIYCAEKLLQALQGLDMSE